MKIRINYPEVSHSEADSIIHALNERLGDDVTMIRAKFVEVDIDDAPDVIEILQEFTYMKGRRRPGTPEAIRVEPGND